MAIQITFDGNVGNYYGYYVGDTVQLNEAGGTASTWLWEIVTSPPSSTASLSSTTLQNPTFTADKYGTYRIKCIIDGGTEEEDKMGGVKTLGHDIRIPALGETTEDGVRGWEENTHDAYLSLDGGNFIKQKIKAGSALATVEECVYFQTSDTTEGCPIAFPITTEDQQPMGMVVSAVVSGEFGQILKDGFYLTPSLSSGAVNDVVFSDPTDGSLTMTPTKWPVGIMVNASAPYACYFDFIGAMGLRQETKFIPIEWAEDGAIPPDATEVITSGNGVVRVRKFDGAIVQDVTIPWETPSDLVVSAGIRAQVVVFITEATIPSTEGVAFKISGYTVADAGALGGTFGTEIKSSKTGMGATYAQYDRFTTDESTVITVTGLAKDTLMMLHVERDVDDADDTYVQKTGIYGVKVLFVVRS